MSKFTQTDYLFQKSIIDKAGEELYGHSMLAFQWIAVLDAIPKDKLKDETLAHVDKHIRLVDPQNNVMLRIQDAKLVFDAADKSKFAVEEKKTETSESREPVKS